MFFFNPQHNSPLETNRKTRSHAQSNMAEFAFHLTAIVQEMNQLEVLEQSE